jgi:2-methylisocitrate lyase-like PEP mutase family enzyme
MPTQSEKGLAFRTLHARDTTFIIPNPWDAGTARLLAHLGFEALATTSSGYAFSAGQRDGTIERDRMIEHVREIAAAVDLPLSADLENGYGDSPEAAAETIKLGAAAGAVGGSIEDATGRADHPIYDVRLAAERIRAAAEAARSLPFAFTLTARAENYLHKRPDLKETIARLQAFQDSGADVLYAPGLLAKDEIAAVVSSVDRPVNVLMGMPDFKLTLADLASIGVKRISTGGALCRAAIAALLRAAQEMREGGTFEFVKDAASSQEISAALRS